MDEGRWSDATQIMNEEGRTGVIGRWWPDQVTSASFSLASGPLTNGQLVLTRDDGLG